LQIANVFSSAAPLSPQRWAALDLMNMRPVEAFAARAKRDDRSEQGFRGPLLLLQDGWGASPSRPFNSAIRSVSAASSTSAFRSVSSSRRPRFALGHQDHGGEGWTNGDRRRTRPPTTAFRMRPNPQLSNLCEMEIVLKSGARKTFHRDHYKNPMTDAEMEEKFRRNGISGASA
jgi:hypothetical protein